MYAVSSRSSRKCIVINIIHMNFCSIKTTEEKGAWSKLWKQLTPINIADNIVHYCSNAWGQKRCTNKLEFNWGQ